MKIKVDNRLEYFLKPINVHTIKHSDGTKESDFDRCSLYPTSMITRQLGHE